jgi:hypothetical protein
MFLTSPGSEGLVYIETSAGFSGHHLKGKRPGRKIVEVSELPTGTRLEFFEPVSSDFLEDLYELVMEPPFDRTLPVGD